MNAEELVKQIECGDLHGAMLTVVRAWLEKYHPQCLGASLYIWTGDGLPATRVTIPASAASAVSPDADAPTLPTRELP